VSRCKVNGTVDADTNGRALGSKDGHLYNWHHRGSNCTCAMQRMNHCESLKSVILKCQQKTTKSNAPTMKTKSRITDQRTSIDWNGTRHLSSSCITAKRSGRKSRSESAESFESGSETSRDVHMTLPCVLGTLNGIDKALLVWCSLRECLESDLAQDTCFL